MFSYWSFRFMISLNKKLVASWAGYFVPICVFFLFINRFLCDHKLLCCSQLLRELFSTTIMVRPSFQLPETSMWTRVAFVHCWLLSPALISHPLSSPPKWFLPSIFSSPPSLIKIVILGPKSLNHPTHFSLLQIIPPTDYPNLHPRTPLPLSGSPLLLILLCLPPFVPPSSSPCRSVPPSLQDFWQVWVCAGQHVLHLND